MDLSRTTTPEENKYKKKSTLELLLFQGYEKYEISGLLCWIAHPSLYMTNLPRKNRDWF